jgi:hypothetical protein
VQYTPPHPHTYVSAARPKGPKGSLLEVLAIARRWYKKRREEIARGGRKKKRVRGWTGVEEKKRGL